MITMIIDLKKSKVSCSKDHLCDAINISNRHCAQHLFLFFFEIWNLNKLKAQVQMCAVAKITKVLDIISIIALLEVFML